MITKDLVPQGVLDPSRSWTGGMLGRRRRVMGDSRGWRDRPTASTLARCAERAGYQPWPLQAHSCRSGRMVAASPPDYGPATKNWHLIAGISGSEKIPEKGPKIEI